MPVPMIVAMIVATATLLQTAALAPFQAIQRQSASAGARAPSRAMAVTRRPMPVARSPMNDDRHCGRLPRAAACGSHQFQDQQHALIQHHAMTDQHHAMID